MPYSDERGVEHFTEKLSWKAHAVAIMRMTVTAFITTVLIILGVTLTDVGQTQQQVKIAETLLHTNLAQACVLSLPVDPVKGRDQDAVRYCFTQYGLEPPEFAPPSAGGAP